MVEHAAHFIQHLVSRDVLVAANLHVDRLLVAERQVVHCGTVVLILLLLVVDAWLITMSAQRRARDDPKRRRLLRVLRCTQPAEHTGTLAKHGHLFKRLTSPDRRENVGAEHVQIRLIVLNAVNIHAAGCRLQPHLVLQELLVLGALLSGGLLEQDRVLHGRGQLADRVVLRQLLRRRTGQRV